MKKLLFIGDAACPSGFARVTHEVLNVLRETYDVTVLGINYRGDPHDFPYPIYAAGAGGDAIGLGRMVWLCDKVKPDVIIIQNDGWFIQSYMQQLWSKKPDGTLAFPEHVNIPVVAIVPVDGKNFQGYWLEGLTHTVFWTNFARKEARQGGFAGPSTVIPLGVDTEIYHPMDRYEARLHRGLPRELDDAFIVGNVNRNQPRKRWDLTVKYFAEWITSKKVDDAYLYLHTAPTGDQGPDVTQLAKYYGVLSRLILVRPPAFYGISEEKMCETYNCFDVQISTTQGEGFGLTTFEGMACGVPQIVPAWSALGELCEGAARLVPCTSTAIGPPYVNVVGGVADERMFVREIDGLYRNKAAREELRAAGLRRVSEDRFRWGNIGEAFRLVTETLLQANAVEAVHAAIAAQQAKAEAKSVAWGMGGEPVEERWADLGRVDEIPA